MPNAKGDLVLAIVGNSHSSYVNESVFPFASIYNRKMNFSYEGSFKYSDDGEDYLADALLLFGGTDIHPSLYGHLKHPKSQQHGVAPIDRDWEEWYAVREAVIYNIPIIGICRGAQLLCAFAGGTLFQDVNNHHHDHEIVTKDGKIYKPRSTHHQMMDVRGTNHELLAWSKEKLATIYDKETFYTPLDDYVKEMKEPEVVWFPDIKGLAIQAHPEWEQTDKTPFANYVLDLVLEKCV